MQVLFQHAKDMSRNNYSAYSGVNAWKRNIRNTEKLLSRNNYSAYSGVNKTLYHRPMVFDSSLEITTPHIAE